LPRTGLLIQRTVALDRDAIVQVFDTRVLETSVSHDVLEPNRSAVGRDGNYVLKVMRPRRVAIDHALPG
jgi:hypothetical protein